VCVCVWCAFLFAGGNVKLKSRKRSEENATSCCRYSSDRSNCNRNSSSSIGSNSSSGGNIFSSSSNTSSNLIVKKLRIELNRIQIMYS